MDTQASNSRDQLPVDELYYGNPNKKCHLSLIPSLVWKFSNDDLRVANNNYTLGQTLKNKAPFDYLGKDYKNIYVPCTPASEILITDYSNSVKREEPSDDLVTCPLIKTQKKGDYEGYTSGKRSAVIFSKNRYFRLKGCGNVDEGFPIDEFQSKKPNSREIRGCQFYGTAVREQYMTNRISEILSKYDVKCGNKPVGFWLYPSEEEVYSRLEIKNLCPRIDKFCGVFETLGEKRLATHLLQGIEVLLHFVVSNYGNKSFAKENILKLYPAERLITDDPSLFITPLSWLGPFLDLPEDQNIHQWTEKPIYPDEAFSQLLNLNEAFKTGNIFNEELFNKFDVAEMVAKFIEKYPSAGDYKDSIQTIFTTLFSEQKAGFIQLLSFLFARVGWECGTIKRILQDNNINWGYYADHNVLYHCNAHPNNFIVLPKGQSRNLLAPLDFDLSFFKENFINIEEEAETYGKYDERTFDIFLNCERYSLEEALSGEENMANFGYSLFKLDHEDEHSKSIYSILKTSLRDTCIYYYRRAYDKYDDEEMKKYDAKNDESIYSLINLALIITRDIVV